MCSDLFQFAIEFELCDVNTTSKTLMDSKYMTSYMNMNMWHNVSLHKTFMISQHSDSKLYHYKQSGCQTS